MANPSIFAAFERMWQHININFDKKGAADTALASAKTYADNVKNDLLNGAGGAYDTLKELGDLIDENTDAVDALEEVAASKANASDLTSHTGNKSNPHGVSLSQLGLTATATELNYVDGVTSNIQTQLNAKVNSVSGKGLSTNDYTTAEKNKLSGIASGAEVNQNAFSNVIVGSTTIAADAKTDSLTVAAGTGISVTGDATNDKVTITNSGVRSVATGGANGTISVNTNGTSANVAVKGLGTAAYTASTAYDAAGTAQTKADAALASSKDYTDDVAAGKANKNQGVYYIEGGGTTDTTNKIASWTGTHPDITEYYAGLMIAYKVGTAGSTTTKLKINNLAEVEVRKNNNSAITTSFPVNSVIFLVYTIDSGVAYWKAHDYDANTRNSVGDYRKNDTKLYFVGTTSSDAATTSSYATSYTNSNIYVDTSNVLNSASGFKGSLTGNATTATKATQDSNGNVINTTYATKTEVDDKINEFHVSVKDYGAVGDGSTDDTTAFQNALANERKVYVPAGTYKLSGELTIGRNCQLELAQDSKLLFTQTTGNCISMRASANIVGNHATIEVKQAFSGQVIYIYAGLDESIVAVPPHTGWGPMWTAARYITDLHIVKTNSQGHAQSDNGTCSGTAILLQADYNDPMHFMWAIDLTRLRIAGAFSYGIYINSITNGDQGWIHQTRINSAFIANAEIGIYCKNSTLSYISAVVLPNPALDGTTYCKHGIVLENSSCTDLSQFRAMDWDFRHTLWRETNEYQHIKLLGNSEGTILGDYKYWATPNYDVRKLIYTDRQYNIDSLVILEEPINKWFKLKDYNPYYYDGFMDYPLVTWNDLTTNLTKENSFTNALSSATNPDGTIFEEKGWVVSGREIISSGTTASNDVMDETMEEANDAGWKSVWGCGCTGLIPVKKGDWVYIKGINLLNNSYGKPNLVLYDKSFTKIRHFVPQHLIDNEPTSHYQINFYETDTGYAIYMKEPTTLGYLRIGYKREDIGPNPIVTVNEPIEPTVSGYLRDGITVKMENVEGLAETLAGYIDDVDALLGGT